MAQYRNRAVVQAVQLRWDTWNDMCVLAEVGRWEDGRPFGVFVLPDGTIRQEPPYFGEDMPSMFPDVRIGLSIPDWVNHLASLAIEGQWVVRKPDGSLDVVDADDFESTYEPVSS